MSDTQNTEPASDDAASEDKDSSAKGAPAAKPARKGPKRNVPTGSSNVQIQTGPNLKKWAPWIGAALTVAVVALLVQTPRFALPGTLAGALIVCGLIAYSCAGYRIMLPPDDPLRPVIAPASVGIVIAAAIPLAWTISPPAPRGTAELREVGQVVSIDLGSGVDLWAQIAAQQAPNVPGNADFTVQASAGAQRERIAGRLHAQSGQLVERRNLTIQGPGAVRFELVGMSSSIAAPLRIIVNARPVPRVWLVALFSLLALAVVAIDVALFRRGIEPSFAAAMCIPLVATIYLQFRPVGGDELPTDVLAAGAIGAIAGGLGGELLARIGRSIAKK
ncbi:MAG: hypothetical protein JNK05_10505 [Myxococcales bacterium]|nr:hypothetical protein [Myxococcales bacterium]